nr:RsiV family protein [uncultured Aggregatibacter sp.]
MKKLFIAVLVAGVMGLTACHDKDTQKQAETIAQLNEQVATLQKQVTDLAENQMIRVEPEVLFQKTEKIPSSTSEENDQEWHQVKFDITTLKTSSDWLTELLLNEVIKRFGVDKNIKIDNKQQFIEFLQHNMADALKEAKEYEMSAYETQMLTEYLGQRENIATFTIFSHNYTGGAHGLYGTDFVLVDLKKKAVIKVEDIFVKSAQDKLKSLLWERYRNQYRNEQGELIEPFMSKDDFYVSENVYFSREGITFVYPPYALGSYAEGEKELTLSFYENDLKSILTPEFQFLVKDTPE